MNYEDLEYFRNRFGEWKSIRVYHDSLKSNKINLETEIKELENNPLIKDYLKKRKDLSLLIDEINRVKRQNSRVFLFDEDRALIQYGSNNYTHTNEIYVCLGAYPKHNVLDCNNYLKIEPNYANFLSIDDKDAEYRIYADIENGYREEVIKSEWNEFEQNNTVLFPRDEDPFKFYKRVRLLFFRECIENTQEEAVAKVLELKK